MCPFSQGWKLHGEGHADEQLQNVCLGVFWLGAQFRCLRSRAQLYSALSDDLSISFQEVWWCPMCPMCNRCVHRTVMWKAENLQRTSKTSCWVVATWSSWRPLFHRNVFLVEAAFASLRVHLYKSVMFWTFLDYPKELEISTYFLTYCAVSSANSTSTYSRPQIIIYIEWIDLIPSERQNFQQGSAGFGGLKGYNTACLCNHMFHINFSASGFGNEHTL